MTDDEIAILRGAADRLKLWFNEAPHRAGHMSLDIAERLNAMASQCHKSGGGFATERRELERAKLHGPDSRTIDALEYVLGAAPMLDVGILSENWHAIEGRNGQCACGPERGRCGDRLAAFIASLREGHKPSTAPEALCPFCKKVGCPPDCMGHYP